MSSEPARDGIKDNRPTDSTPVTLPQIKEITRADEKSDSAFVENAVPVDANLNLTYDEDELEPELHFRTWLAIAAMFTLNLVQVFALLGPPAVVSSVSSYLDLTRPMVLTEDVAVVHRCQPQQHSGPELDPQLALPGSGCAGARYLVCLRHLPSSQDFAGCIFLDLTRGFSDCSGIAQHLQTDCRSNSHWRWLRVCSLGICCAE